VDVVESDIMPSKKPPTLCQHLLLLLLW